MEMYRRSLTEAMTKMSDLLARLQRSLETTILMQESVGLTFFGNQALGEFVASVFLELPVNLHREVSSSWLANLAHSGLGYI
jgi:hypothetical protein